MTKIKADNLLPFLQEYLKSEARFTGLTTQDNVIFKLQNKPKMRLEDAAGRLYDIDEAEIHQFTSKVQGLDSIRWVRIRNYDVETRFDFKNGLTKCTELTLLSTDFDFIGDGGVSHNAKGPLLRINVLPSPFKLTDLPEKVRGYLTRIGKRKFVSQAEMVINEIDSLIDYIPKHSNPLSQLNEINRKKVEDLETIRKLSKTNFLTHLNAEGLRQLNKFTHLLKRRDLFDHIVRLNFNDQLLQHQIGSILVKPEHLKEDDDGSEVRSEE